MMLCVSAGEDGRRAPYLLPALAREAQGPEHFLEFLDSE